MAGTFVATPSKALTIEHEPTGQALTQFKPEEAKQNLEQIEILAGLGVKLRDDAKLHELAVRKLETIVDIVVWVDQHVQEKGGHDGTRYQNVRERADRKFSVPEIMDILGYHVEPRSGSATIYRWRQLAKAAEENTDGAVEKILRGWRIQAGMIPRAEPKEKPEEDRDLAVESIFRAYTKLDPDQRIELKQKIMAFEKSYKDPFAPKAA